MTQTSAPSWRRSRSGSCWQLSASCGRPMAGGCTNEWLTGWSPCPSACGGSEDSMTNRWLGALALGLMVSTGAEDAGMARRESSISSDPRLGPPPAGLVFVDEQQTAILTVTKDGVVWHGPMDDAARVFWRRVNEIRSSMRSEWCRKNTEEHTSELQSQSNLVC